MSHSTQVLRHPEVRAKRASKGDGPSASAAILRGSRCARAPQDDGTSALGKQNRGQPLAPVDGGFVGRSPYIEKLKELPGRAVVVPFAIALDDRDQVLERVGALALAVERQRQIEARLMVERVGGDLLLELVDRPECLGLLGKLQRGAGRGDRRVILLRLR